MVRQARQVDWMDPTGVDGMGLYEVWKRRCTYSEGLALAHGTVWTLKIGPHSVSHSSLRPHALSTLHIHIFHP